MAMKKTSGGDSPLRQGAGKSFWTLPIFGSTAAADRDVFWKTDRALGFSRQGVYVDERGLSEVEPRGLTRGWRGQGPGRAAPVCGGHVAPLRQVFGCLGAPR